jgi:hypothetical protein
MADIQLTLGAPDWALLRQQKQVLIDMRAGTVTTHNEVTLLTGLLHFLDHLQDRAALMLGENKVFCEYEYVKRETGHDQVPIQALFMYWYNTNPEEIMRALYTDPIAGYLREKIRAYQHGLVEFWGDLDSEHQQILLANALVKYGDEARRRL